MNHSVLIDGLYAGRIGMRIHMNSDRVIITTRHDRTEAAITKQALTKVPRHRLESTIHKMQLHDDTLIQTEKNLYPDELVMLCKLSNDCW